MLVLEDLKTEKFEVQGAGDIVISEVSHIICGTAEGFSIGVTWGVHGSVGGVIDKAEAKRLAEFILKNI